MNKSFFVSLFCGLLLTTAFYAQTPLSIAEVQGDKYVSPHADKKVTVQGVVTALRRRGFYIQTPDEKIDDDPKTSEGIYIFTLDPPASNIAIGNLVEVTGFVTEYRPKRERYALFLTEITKPKIKIISEENPLPKPILLTETHLKPKGQLDQMERFEGMRIKIEELKVVAPTGGFFNRKEGKIKSDGVFYGVLPKTPRPFREPGLDALMVLLDKLPQTLPVFDMNPELIRVDSNGLNDGVPIDVTAGAKIKNLVGIIDYSFRSYTFLIDPSVKPIIENNREFIKASPATKNEVTIASFNLENFFDDEENSDLKRKETKVSSEHFEKRLKKASLAIRNVVSMPDVLGVIEVENLAVLKKLADRVNADAIAAEQPNPKYEAVLEESNDLRGIDVGFLIKTAKVKVKRTEHLAKKIKLNHKDAHPEETLFSRPPFLVEVEVPIEGEETGFAFTIIVNHFKSYRQIDHEKHGNRVRNKKRMQAEFLNKFVYDRQQKNPEERIVVIGDFNSFQFNDGYNDLIGTLKGKPNQTVLAATEKAFDTGLINLVDYIKTSGRYSYVFGGSAQVLDHILINKPARNNAIKFGYARLNADFPKVYENDETRPERISDHDVPVLYLSLINKKVKMEKKAVSAKEKSSSLNAFLFYLMGDKNSEETTSSDLETWIGTKIVQIAAAIVTNSLFDLKGGGPNGSYWNPTGDLYLFIHSSSSDDLEFSVNGKVTTDLIVEETSSTNKTNTIYRMKISSDFWKTNLRKIEESDLIALFGKEKVAAVKADETSAIAPLTTGKIIDFKIKLVIKLSKDFSTRLLENNSADAINNS